MADIVLRPLQGGSKASRTSCSRYCPLRQGNIAAADSLIAWKTIMIERKWNPETLKLEDAFFPVELCDLKFAYPAA